MDSTMVPCKAHRQVQCTCPESLQRSYGISPSPKKPLSENGSFASIPSSITPVRSSHRPMWTSSPRAIQEEKFDEKGSPLHPPMASNEQRIPESSSANEMLESTNEEPTLLTIPSLKQINTQYRRQMLQRFFDLHLGVSNNARRIFNYEALDSIRTGDPNMLATTAALDTL